MVREGHDWKLEKAADALLRADAERQGYVVGRRASRQKHERGMVDYMRDHGMTNDDTEDLTHRHEAVGFTEEQLEHLHAQVHGEKHTRGGVRHE